MKYLFLIIGLVFFTSACSDDINPNDTNDPSDLSLSVLIHEDGSGKVIVSAKAANAVEYHFLMGDGGTEAFVNTDGVYEYTYQDFGSYTIQVKAFGQSGRFIKKEKFVLVNAGTQPSKGDGYVSPTSYEGMQLVWSDEFSGKNLNDNFWSYDIGTGCPDLCGWGNNELEYYRPNNSWIADGVLTLEARKENFEGSEYTSTKIVTRNKKDFHYGRIDIRALLPKGQGIWPALWMLGTNHQSIGWPFCGEIDVMEMIGGNGRENTVSGNAFWDDGGVKDNPSKNTLDQGTYADEYHVFSVIWDDAEITWLVDDVKFKTLNTSSEAMDEFRKPFYLIFNVAVGGNWPGSPDASTSFPTQMKIDYVRYFQEQ